MHPIGNYLFESRTHLRLVLLSLSSFSLSLSESLHNSHGFVFPESQHLTNRIQHFGFIMRYHARFSCHCDWLQLASDISTAKETKPIQIKSNQTNVAVLLCIQKLFHAAVKSLAVYALACARTFAKGKDCN